MPLPASSASPVSKMYGIKLCFMGHVALVCAYVETFTVYVHVRSHLSECRRF